ncbi:hypothetical protein scyTo_0014563 [Scyliorhinus torazame]|uniref:Uncharacterized protein n=1 Tax=Scyliorhinus torazame TaxID=75743 RepID=A0A401NPY4_SCYTO|nr:hypothetical protein [Scyliorhinus torazame]
MLLALTLAWVASAYSIEIQNETYSCGLTHWVVVRIPLHFNFSTSCKEEWTEFPKKILIALVATPSEPQCHLPCVKVSHREIILNECLQVKLLVICDDGIKTWETRIVFHGKETRRTPKEENSGRRRLCK